MKKLVLLITLTLSFNALSSVNLIYKAKDKKIELEEDDKDILKMGKISTTRYVTGGILGTYPLGFGIGHAIQGTWSHRGWMFTAGELGSLAVLIAGISSISCSSDEDGLSCGGNGLTTVGLIGFVGFRIWEIVDLWAGVPTYNRKYKELKTMIESKGKKEDETKVSFAPVFSHDLKPGLGLRFTF